MTDVIVIVHFELFFALLPPNSQKKENFKKNNQKKTKNNQTNKQQQQQKSADMILHKSTKNHDHMLCCFLNMVRECCNFIFHFELFFALLLPKPTAPPLTAHEIKISKKKKEKRIDIILHKCTKNYD